MALTLTTADAALKELYLPAVRDQLNNGTPLLNIIDQKKVDVEGRRAVLSLRTGRNNTVIARAEGGTFPTTFGNQGYTEERVSMRYLYGHVQVSGQTIKAMKSDKGSFVRAVRSEMEGVTSDLQRDVNRQLFGDGTGAIIRCKTTSSSTTVNLSDSATETQVRQLFVGQRIDIGTVAEMAGTGSPVAQDVQITAIDTSAFTITVSGSAVTTDTNDYIATFGNAGVVNTNQKELTGLQAIVASSGTLFNVNPTSVPEWVSSVNSNSGTPRSLSESLMADTVHKVFIASGEWPDIGICSEGVWRAYANLLTGQKRFTGTLELKGGYAGLEFTAGGKSIPIVFDRDAPGHRSTTVGGSIYFLNKSHLFFGQESDWEWMEEDGSVLHRRETSDAYFATLYKYGDLFTDKRNAHGVLKDILKG